MRGTVIPPSPSRVKGQASLTRRVAALVLAAVRYHQFRARSHAELMWSARLIDRLNDALAAARDEG